MKGDSLDLDKFLDEMVSLINERFENQEKTIKSLKREIENIKRGMKQMNGGKPRVDKSVLRVLSGK
jgi:cell division protein FtsB